MRKELSHVMLELHNVRMKPSSMKKKLREPLSVTKELSYVMLEPHNVRMEPSNVRKKVREPPNVRKKLSHVGLSRVPDDPPEPTNPTGTDP